MKIWTNFAEPSKLRPIKPVEPIKESATPHSG